MGTLIKSKTEIDNMRNSLREMGLLIENVIEKIKNESKERNM